MRYEIWFLNITSNIYKLKDYPVCLLILYVKNPRQTTLKEVTFVKRPLWLTSCCWSQYWSHYQFPGCLEVRSWFGQGKQQVIQLYLADWIATLSHFFQTDSASQVTPMLGQQRHQRHLLWPAWKCWLLWHWDKCHTADPGQGSSHSWDTVWRYTFQVLQGYKRKGKHHDDSEHTLLVLRQ